MIICLETATSLCSVALCDRNGIISVKESREGRSHAAVLTLFIRELLEEAGIKASDLEAVAVSKGPGSYTGLRIGVSAAKGIAYAASIPLIGLDTTTLMFHGFVSSRDDLQQSDLFCPMLDARRMEVYYSLLDISGNILKDTRAEIIDKNSFRDIAGSSRIFLFGDGSSKCRGVTERENIVIDESFSLSASFMQKPAYKALAENHFEDTAYFEPFYLKDFLTTKPVRNIL